MAKDKKIYARYIYNRGLATLWKGDPANPGARFRSVAIVTDQFNSTLGVFQVYALEGIGKGIENGKFAGTDGEPRLLIDKEFEGMEAAAEQFGQLVKEAEAEVLRSSRSGTRLILRRKQEHQQHEDSWLLRAQTVDFKIRSPDL